MITQENITKIPTHLIKDLDKFLTHHYYKSDAHIIYKGHIPNCGFLLVEGEINLKLSKNKDMSVVAGSLVGLKELMSSEPFKFDVCIKSDSVVYLIDRSTVLEILNSDQNEKIKDILNQELAS